MKILTARLASEDRFWSRTTLCSLPEILDSSCGIWFKMILGVGPTFRRSELQMEIPPSPLSPKYRFQSDSIYGLYVSESERVRNIETSQLKFEGL